MNVDRVEGPIWSSKGIYLEEGVVTTVVYKRVDVTG
jgi:hypothetical protein